MADGEFARSGTRPVELHSAGPVRLVSRYPMGTIVFVGALPFLIASATKSYLGLAATTGWILVALGLSIAALIRGRVVIDERGVTDVRVFGVRQWSWDQAAALSYASLPRGGEQLAVCIRGDRFPKRLRGYAAPNFNDTRATLSKIADSGWPAEPGKGEGVTWWDLDPRSRRADTSK